MKTGVVRKIIYAAAAAVVLFCMSAVQVCAQEAKENFLRRDADGHYLLSSRNDFEEFIDVCRKDGSASARLVCDIVLNDEEAFEGQHNLSTFGSLYEGELDDMKGYSGDFDGNGHTLEGYVSCENLPVFFIIEKEGTVHDLNIVNSVFSPTYNKRSSDRTQYNASIAEVNRGTIKNCRVRGAVVGKGQAAGIAGVNESTGLIEDTTFSGKITGGYGLKIKPDPGIRYAFDLVVIDNGRIVNCSAKDAVKMTGGSSTPYRISKKGEDGSSGDPGFSGNSGLSGNFGETGLSGGIVSGKDAVSENSGRSADDEDDHIGPERDMIIKLVKGDTLWHLSRVYYGRGILYKNMKLRGKNGVFGGLEGHVLTRLPIGEEVLIPRITVTDKQN
ncbi:MAG: hypothetical protein IJS86_05235 [Lachnospiraceae bacterium]|nr:hypothetical protein [Lachnospiraceae bacterium]